MIEANFWVRWPRVGSGWETPVKRMVISSAWRRSCRQRRTPGTPPCVAPIRRRRRRSPAWGVIEMRRLIAVVLAGSTIVAGFAARAETVIVQAGSFGNFRQLLSRQALSGDEKF